ncbi:MAG: class I SAM-dependent methyltransferase [Candidatus Micrarchaeota archaeon]
MDNVTHLSKKRLDEIYEEDWGQEELVEPDITSYTEAYTQKRIHESAYNPIIAELRRKKKGNVLDIGTGNGINVFKLNEGMGFDEHYKFYGIDISASAARKLNKIAKLWGRNNLKFMQGDAENLKFKDAVFDCTIQTEVLEHLPHPQRSINEMFRVIKPGGLCVITTPNEQHPLRKVVPSGYRKQVQAAQSSWAHRYDNHPEYFKDRHALHISVQSKWELKEKLEKAGFEEIRFIRQPLFFGGRFYDKHPFLFAFTLFVDKVLDLLSAITWSHNFVVLSKKPRNP